MAGSDMILYGLAIALIIAWLFISYQNMVLRDAEVKLYDANGKLTTDSTGTTKPLYLQQLTGSSLFKVVDDVDMLTINFGGLLFMLTVAAGLGFYAWHSLAGGREKINDMISNYYSMPQPNMPMEQPMQYAPQQYPPQ
jgi:hypothetical protein